MAIIRVTAPGDVAPAVISAQVTRALHDTHHHPIAAELVYVPAWHSRQQRGQRRHCFAAVLTAAGHDSPSKLARRARRTVLPTLRHEFGDCCTFGEICTASDCVRTATPTTPYGIQITLVQPLA